jgi:FixJ family two-component response regulator
MRTGGVLGDQDETYEAVRAGILPMAFCRGFSVVYEREGARAGSVDFLSFPAESTEDVLEMLVEALATLNIEPKRVAQA